MAGEATMKLVHLTDPRLSGPNRAGSEQCPIESFRTTLAHIERHHPDAVLGILSGEALRTGRPAAASGLQRLIDASPIPWTRISGGSGQTDALPQHPVTVPDTDGRCPSNQIDSPIGRFLVPDMLGGDAVHGRWLPWLQEALATAETDGRDVFLILQQPPFDPQLYSSDRQGARKREQLLQALDRAPLRLRHLFIGPFHRPINGSWRGLGFSALPGRNQTLRLALATGRTSMDSQPAGSPEPQPYGVIVIEPAQPVSSLFRSRNSRTGSAPSPV